MKKSLITKTTLLAVGIGVVSFAPAQTLHTFIPNTRAESAQVNHNFAVLLAELQALNSRADALTTKLQQVSVGSDAENRPQLVFNGINVYIRNGSGETGSNNSRGNLIIGNNDDSETPLCTRPGYLAETTCTDNSGYWVTNRRSGSHSLVIGERHDYANFATLIVGQDNRVNAANAAVLGGQYNLASGFGSVVGGGFYNSISSNYAVVNGGARNIAAARHSAVLGGNYNRTNASYSTVNGGQRNEANGLYSNVSGGSDNRAFGSYSSVLGGFDNIANGQYSSIGGGRHNRIDAAADHAHIGGGRSNRVTRHDGSISGGQDNRVTATYASVGGGFENTASGAYSHVAGGEDNESGGTYSVVSGGRTRSVDNIYDWRAGLLFEED